MRIKTVKFSQNLYISFQGEKIGALAHESRDIGAPVHFFKKNGYLAWGWENKVITGRIPDLPHDWYSWIALSGSIIRARQDPSGSIVVFELEFRQQCSSVI